MLALLDTNVFVWAVSSPEQLSPDARAVLLDDGCTLLLSAASVWEMAIKASLGKLDLEVPLEDLVGTHRERLGARLQAIEPEHAVAVRHLPFHHRDPFDRLLVAQCRCLGATLITRDRELGAYDVRRIW